MCGLLVRIGQRARIGVASGTFGSREAKIIGNAWVPWCLEYVEEDGMYDGGAPTSGRS